MLDRERRKNMSQTVEVTRLVRPAGADEAWPSIANHCYRYVHLIHLIFLRLYECGGESWPLARPLLASAPTAFAFVVADLQVGNRRRCL